MNKNQLKFRTEKQCKASSSFQDIAMKMKEKVLKLPEQIFDDNDLENEIKKALKIVTSATPKTDEPVDILKFWSDVFENHMVL